MARAAVLCLALVAAGAGAQEEAQVVNVDGIKNAEMNSYRYVMSGLDAYEEFHHLAPAATELRFRVLGRTDAARAARQGVTIRIAGDGDSLQLPIADDGLFTIPRIQEAWAADAELVYNRKKGLFSSAPEIRTPGLPENVRRLGDLRLECKVSVAIVKNELNMFIRGMINTFLLTSDWCGAEKLHHFGYKSATLLSAAVLRDGDRTLNLETRGWNYQVPISDKRWPDDSLVTLTPKE